MASEAKRVYMREWRERNLERLRAVDRERHRLTYQSRHGVKHAKRQPVPSRARPSMLNLYWAAGFIEGEGSFILNRGSCYIAVHQKQREPLERLLAWFGGIIRQRPTDKRWPNSLYHDWRAAGVRARGIMMTLYQLMSPRRQEQIRRALGVQARGAVA